MNPTRLAFLAVVFLAACGDSRIETRTHIVEQAGLTPGGVCGDGVNNEGEQCDDGNTNSIDGCHQCVITSGYTCTLTSPSMCTQCGSGKIALTEECDDGNLTPGDGCSALCTLEPPWTCPVEGQPCIGGCGDGVRQASEACDDGFAYNGQPGMCSVNCASVMEWDVTSSSGALTLRAGWVGVLASNFDGVGIGNFDGADYVSKVNTLDTAAMVAGRVGQLPFATIVANPVMLFDDGVDAIDGGGTYDLPVGMVDVLPGTYLLDAGTWVMSPVATGVFSGTCPCGVGGSQTDFECANNGAGGLPGFDPNPGCVGPNVDCPDWQKFEMNNVSLDGGPLNPPTGGKMGCDRQCWVAGGATQSCTNEPTGPRIVIGTLTQYCMPSDAPNVDRLCQQVSMAGCPGYCEGSPLELCGGTYAGETGDNSCLIMRDGTGACYDDGNNVPGALDTLSGLDQWFRCVGAGGLASDCNNFLTPLGRGLLGEDEKVVVIDDGTGRSSVCTEHSTGGACIPVTTLPNDDRIAHIQVRDNPWATPKATNEGNVSALAPIALGRVDPRLVTTHPETDPVASSSGELLLTAEDISYPSRGVPFAFERFYRSGGTRSGSLGPGWTHSYEERIEIVGDDFNRVNMPLYCLAGLPKVPNCLLHQRAGGSQLYVRKEGSPYYVSAAGDFSIIAATGNLTSLAMAQSASDRFDETKLPTEAWVMRSPGGITRTFDLTGVLLSITDELGYGVALDWRLRDTPATLAEGSWLNAEVVHARQFQGTPDGAAIAAAHNNRVNRLSRLELDAAVDSFGRVFVFKYETWKQFNAPVAPANEETQRRRRLRAIELAGNTTPLVTYEHNGTAPVINGTNLVLTVTNDAYLTKATRNGQVTASTPAGTPLTIEYEYPHGLFALGGALFDTDSGVPDGPLAKVFRDYLKQIGDDTGSCMGALTANRINHPNPADRCGVSWTDEESPGVVDGSLTNIGIRLAIRRAIADNIIRVRQGRVGATPGKIELENYYSIDFTSPDFDRVVEQRFGAVSTPSTETISLSLPLLPIPAPPPPPALPAPPMSPPVVVHNWLTAMPTVTLREIGGINFNTVTGAPILTDSALLTNLKNRRFVADNATVPPALFAKLVRATLVPEVTEPTGINPGCDPLLASYDLLPSFNPEKPAGKRDDEALADAPILGWTTANCAAIAGRHQRDAFDSGLLDPRTFVEGALFPTTRRQRLEWDAALACRFVQTVDREGVTRTDALNFRGEVLASEGPSPSGSGRVVTTRRYNADGMLVEEVRPDGGRTVFAYDVSTGTFQHDRALRRGNVVEMLEVPAPTTGTLEAALDHGLSTAVAPTGRQWIFTYEPLFQQLRDVTDPAQTKTTTRYDYEQVPNGSSQEDELEKAYAEQTGGLLTLTTLGIDFDGDGSTNAELSAQPVVVFTNNVNTGAGTVDVGQRMLRDHTGRLLRTTSISDDANPALDFDAHTYAYYDNLSNGEAGIFDGSACDSCDRGPLVRERILRDLTSTNANDIHETRYMWDAVGGVRHQKSNIDSATTVVTQRNSLGQVIQSTAYGETNDYVHDSRGNLLTSVRTSADSTPLVTVNSWGNQGVLLGTCTELVSGACAAFDGFVATTQSAARAFSALPAPPLNARVMVTLLDDEDRAIGSYDTAGLRTNRVLNEAGFVSSEDIGGTPATFIRYTRDVMGRVIREAVGSSSTDQLERFFKFDTFGRAVASESRAPLTETAFNDAVGTVDRVGYNSADQVVLRQTIVRQRRRAKCCEHNGCR